MGGNAEVGRTPPNSGWKDRREGGNSGLDVITKTFGISSTFGVDTFAIPNQGVSFSRIKTKIAFDFYQLYNWNFDFKNVQ